LKRLLAYSSVEHMGVIAVGVGLGGPLGAFGALLHTFNHSIAKSLLFFSAGSVRENLGTLRMDRITGLAKILPWTTAGLVIGGVAIVGMPPLSLFVSEFAILSESFAQSRYVIGFVFLATLSLVFGGFLTYFMRMSTGEPEAPLSGEAKATSVSEFAVMGVCVALLVGLGVYMPEAFQSLLRGGAEVLRR